MTLCRWLRKSFFKIEYDLFDSVGGVFNTIVGRTVPETTTFLGIDVHTEAEAFTIRKILYGLKGRQKTFWLPTFRNDFTVTTTIGSADLTITFEENDFDRFVTDAPDPWSGLYIELFDGTQFFRLITGSTPPVAGEESISINSPLGQIVTAAEIRFASLLVRCRLNQDRISIDHMRLGNIRVRVPVVGVKESI